jgi:hypothetical protein
MKIIKVILFVSINLILVSCSEVKSVKETKITHDVKVENWGPRETLAGTRFNIQPNGQSAVWVTVKGVSRHPKTHVIFGGEEISGTDLAVQDEAVTFLVRDELIQKSGLYEVAIFEGDTGRKILIGNFEVKKN